MVAPYWNGRTGMPFQYSSYHTGMPFQYGSFRYGMAFQYGATIFLLNLHYFHFVAVAITFYHMLPLFQLHQFGLFWFEPPKLRHIFVNG